MSDTEIKLMPGRPNRGKFPITLRRGDEVLLTGEVNPHKSKEIDSFIKDACKKFKGLKDQKDDLRAVLLQLAVPKEKPKPRAPQDYPYSETFGVVYWLKPMGDADIPVPLLNFLARIVANVVRDDGTERETAFEIETLLAGKKQTLMIPAGRFNAMNWPAEHLGAQAIVYPGLGTRDHARAAIQFLSPMPTPSKVIFTHTGWRKLDDGNGGNGGWAYLHGGGAIGSLGTVEDVQVELTGALAQYELPNPPQGDELKAAIRASMDMLALAKDSIVFPAFCMIWRAALGSSDFGGHLAGPTGVFKSELAALAQQHWGAGLDARHLPGSWHSTDNALEGLLFSAKDAITVIDDFAPCGGPHDVARWHQRADRIIRAQGNNAGRGRMRADGSLRPPKPPRGLVLSTGEDIPRGQSIRARMHISEISKGDINTNILSRCQKDARSGKYAAAMAGFVRFLAGRYDQIRQTLRSEVEDLRRQATRSGSHCRTPEIVANLALGLKYFISFAQEAGAITELEGSELWNRGWSALEQAGNQQADYQAANEPAQRFLELITSAIASGHAHLADRDGNAPPKAEAWGWRAQAHGNGRDEWQPQGDRIGWLDGDDVLLDPDASYRAAQVMAGAQGEGLSITAATLRKRLDEKGMLIRQRNRGELTIRRVLQGKQLKVLHLARGLLSAQSTISTISTSNPDSEPKNGDKWRNQMVENSPAPGAIHHQNPPSDPSGDTENGPVAANGGNGEKDRGNTPAGTGVMEV